MQAGADTNAKRAFIPEVFKMMVKQHNALVFIKQNKAFTAAFNGIH